MVVFRTKDYMVCTIQKDGVTHYRIIHSESGILCWTCRRKATAIKSCVALQGNADTDAAGTKG